MKLPSFGLLRDASFRKLFLSNSVSAVGDSIEAFAFQLVAVVSLAAGVFEVGVLAAMTSIAFLLISLPAGVWVDRLRRRSVIIAANLLRASIFVSVPIIWWTGHLAMWHLYIAALLIGAGKVFAEVAYQSYLPSIVGRENLIEANSKLTGVQQLSIVAGPSLSGQLVAALSAPVALAFSAGTSIISCVFVGSIQEPENTKTREHSEKRSLAKEVGEGFQYILKSKLLRAMTISITWVNFCSAMNGAVLTIFMVRTLQLSPEALGLVLTVAAIGSLFGALTARALADYLGQGTAMWVILLCAGFIYFVPPAVGTDWRLYCLPVALGIASAAIIASNIIQSSARQALTPDHLMGRVNATMRFLTWGILPIGSVVGGSLGSVIGPRYTLLVAAVLGSLSFVPIFFSPLRSMRTVSQSLEAQVATN